MEYKVFNITDNKIEFLDLINSTDIKLYNIYVSRFTRKTYQLIGLNSNNRLCSTVDCNFWDLYSSEGLKVVGVKFDNNPVVYHYFCKYEDVNNFNLGDRIVIDAIRGRSTVTVVCKKEVPADTPATKLLPLIRNDIPKTPRPISEEYYNFKVSFINSKKGLSRPYYYSAIARELPITIQGIPRSDLHYAILRENKEFVAITLESKTVTPDYRLKHFDNIELTDWEDLVLPKMKNHDLDDCEQAIKAFRNRGYFETQTDKHHFIRLFDAFIKAKENDNIIIKEEKENKTMNMNKIFGNMEFGKMNTNAIKYSVAGLAFRGADGSYLTYDLDKMEATNVADMVFDMDCVFAMPIAAKDVKRGDIVKHQGNFVIIKDKYEDGTIAAINPVSSTEVTIIPVKNVFGFNYVTKIFNMFEGMAPNGDNPFGDMSKMLPMMMFMGEKGNNDMFSMFAMMSMYGGDCKDMMSNPLMMYALMKGDM